MLREKFYKNYSFALPLVYNILYRHELFVSEPSSKDEDEKIPEQIVSKKENCTLLRPMDGELDYEEEVDEDKEKKAFDLEKKEDAEPEKKVK